MSLKDLIKHIDELQAQIQAHGKLDTETLKRINYKFRLDWNYNSNVMEGNSLTKRETRTIMIGNITIEGKPMKDVLEMRGHNEILENILKIGKGELNLSENRIIEIHKGIMYEDDPEKKKDIGVWKKHNNYLYNYKNERVDFTPFTEVREKMHELINWLNTQKEKIAAKDKKALHPVVLAFEFHLRYVSIHPFYDGNGRTSRIFTNLILIAYGYPPIIVKLEEKEKYYQYLADIQSYGGSPDLFYEFMGGLLERSQQIVLTAIEGGDIEEPDDFDKKISLFTKRLEEHKDVVKLKKNVEIQKKLFNQVFEPFLKRLDARFGKLIHLFFESNYVSDLYSNLEGSGKVLDFHLKRLNSALGVPNFNEMGINHVLKQFKRAENAFDVYTLVTIGLDDFKYKIGIKISDFNFGDHFANVMRLIIEKDKEEKSVYYEYIVCEEYFHNIPSKEIIEKIADKAAEYTFAYIESRNSKKN